MKLRGLIASVLLITLSLIVGCNDSENKEQNQNQELRLETNDLEEKLNEAHSTIDKLQNENRRLSAELISVQKESEENRQMYSDMKSNYQWVVNEYENFYFSICNEVKSNKCPPELIYFDPRDVKVGDQLFGMTVSNVEISTFDPTSYVISFQDTAIITGQYEINMDHAMGPYFGMKTSHINGKDVSIGLGIGGDWEKIDEIFASKRSGDVTLKVDNFIIQHSPYKPASNGARFVELVKD